MLLLPRFSRYLSTFGSGHQGCLFAQTRQAAGAVQQLVMEQSASTWEGTLSQEQFMQKDMCITVDESDNLVGSGSKYQCHRFEAGQPQGILHRAFSVFLFNSDSKLLLQQRASTKITFPSVWTNTCCSHPLHGFDPPELDSPADILNGSVPGAKRAAVRKLQQELGIEPSSLPTEDFKYLTRLHYCAPDADGGAGGSEGKVEGQGMGEGVWGEHEMDYILFIKADVELTPNPEEVDDVKYVTYDELLQMMQPSSGLKWSPWFRIIAEKFLKQWWEDLPLTLSTDKYVDVDSIHKVVT